MLLLVLVQTASVGAIFTPSMVTVTGQVATATAQLYDGSVTFRPFPLLNTNSGYVVVNRDVRARVSGSTFIAEVPAGYYYLSVPEHSTNVLVYFSGLQSTVNVASAWSSSLPAGNTTVYASNVLSGGFLGTFTVNSNSLDSSTWFLATNAPSMAAYQPSSAALTNWSAVNPTNAASVGAVVQATGTGTAAWGTSLSLSGSVTGTNSLRAGASGTNFIADSGTLLNGVGITNGTIRSPVTCFLNGVIGYQHRFDNGYYGSGGAATVGWSVYGATPPILKCIDGNGNPNGGILASNFIFSFPRWVDEKVSGASIRVGGTSPTRTEVEAGTGIYGIGFSAGEDVDFSMQWSHGTASTNANLLNFYYSPHLHISATGLGSGTNCAFKITYQVSAPNVTYSNSVVTLTNWITFTNASMHHLLSFGNVTNNVLQGKDSVVVRGNISCLTNNTGSRVILDSADFHIPIDSVGSTAINGD